MKTTKYLHQSIQKLELQVLQNQGQAKIQSQAKTLFIILLLEEREKGIYTSQVEEDKGIGEICTEVGHISTLDPTTIVTNHYVYHE